LYRKDISSTNFDVNAYHFRNQFSPGTQLFHALKDYANVLYSLLLMKMDYQMAESSPKRRKDYYLILNSLSHVQTNVKPTDEIRLQMKNVETAITKLTQENLKLSVEQYKAKSLEILQEINSLSKLKIKYLPLANKIMNYVKPNMQKRRFSSEIIPQVSSEIEKLVTELSQFVPHQSTLIHKMETSTASQEKQQRNVDVLKSNFTIVVSGEGCRNVISGPPALATDKLLSQDAPEMEMCNTETRKRKKESRPKDACKNEKPLKMHLREKILIKSVSNPSIFTPTPSPINTPQEVDLDDTPCLQKTTFQVTDINNCVKTAQEAYTTYRTYSPISQTLPELSNPPDTARLAILSEHISPTMKQNVHDVCSDIQTNSFPKGSLLTFHSRGHKNFPKTHVALKVTPTALSSNDILDVIPANSNFVFEILLFDHTFRDYKNHLCDFVTWATLREADLLFTIPEMYFIELQTMLPTLNLIETARPFQAALCTSLIT
jgi:hypothetical protein